MAETTIAWADYSYNPWIGCTKVGIGCIGCYAEAYDNRFNDGGHWGAGAPRRRTSESTRRAPHKWNKKAHEEGTIKRVFSHSLSDVFDNDVAQRWREEEFYIWRSTPYLRWIVLTKRPSNITKMLPKDWDPVGRYRNVGFCVSVSNQEEFDREVPKLAQVDARWLGVSIEPQVAPIKLDNIGFHRSSRIRWIITGGASEQPGYDAPRYDVGWARSLISQCRTAGITCFVKQLGAKPYNLEIAGPHFPLVHRAGADPKEWPVDVRVQEFPRELME